MAIDAAPAKVIATLELIDSVLHKQEEAGSKFLVGNSLTAADIYWVSALIMVDPPPEEILPRLESNTALLKLFVDSNTDAISAAVTERIRAHSAATYSGFLEVPVPYGGN